eukprot:2075606-Prymnesium_polylepis.2
MASPCGRPTAKEENPSAIIHHAVSCQWCGCRLPAAMWGRAATRSGRGGVHCEAADHPAWAPFSASSTPQALVPHGCGCVPWLCSSVSKFAQSSGNQPMGLDPVIRLAYALRGRVLGDDAHKLVPGAAGERLTRWCSPCSSSLTAEPRMPLVGVVRDRLGLQPLLAEAEDAAVQERCCKRRDAPGRESASRQERIAVGVSLRHHVKRLLAEQDVAHRSQQLLLLCSDFRGVSVPLVVVPLLDRVAADAIELGLGRRKARRHVVGAALEGFNNDRACHIIRRKIGGARGGFRELRRLVDDMLKPVDVR